MAKTTSSDEPHIRYCLGCGYDLRLLQGTRCPECGRSFDPDDDTPYHRPRYNAHRLAGEVLTTFAFAILITLGSSITSVIGLAVVLVWQYFSFKDALYVYRHEPGRIDHKVWMKPALIAQVVLIVLLVLLFGLFSLATVVSLCRAAFP